jgi:hypothetical protein
MYGFLCKGRLLCYTLSFSIFFFFSICFCLKELFSKEYYSSKVLWAFCVPLRLGANWGYWPSDSVFDQGGGVHHKLLMFLTWMGSFACHWHRHQVQGASVLRLIRRTRAIEIKQLAQGCKQTWQWRESNPQHSDHEFKTLTFSIIFQTLTF